MLDFEKCKEVVGLWDDCDLDTLKREFEESEFYGTDHEFDFEWYLKIQVNSWRGFGLTVEAMEKRGFHFFADDYITFQRFDGQAQTDGEPQFTTGIKLKSDNGGMIPATHLAALEAVKDANK